MEKEMLAMQDPLNGIKTHRKIVFKFPKSKTAILQLILFFVYTNVYSQIKFEKEKWIADKGIDSLYINSYRAYIVEKGIFWELVKGKTKKQINKDIGKYDFKEKGNRNKGIYESYTYCIGKSKINKKCNQCNGASISILFKDGVAFDIIGVFSGG